MLQLILSLKKNWLLLSMKFFILFFSLFLFSCKGLLPPILGGGTTPPQKRTHPILIGTTPTTSIPTPPATGQKIGVVKCQTQAEMNQFNINLRKFLSTTINPNQVGSHACTKSISGGVFFDGHIRTNKPIVTTENNLDIIINPEGSYIRFHFETFSPNKPNIAPIPFRYTYGSIDGQQIVLTFEDSKGEVKMNGQLATRSDGKRLFIGHITFHNYQRYDGQNPGYNGRLGDFAIETCHFFQC